MHNFNRVSARLATLGTLWFTSFIPVSDASAGYGFNLVEGWYQASKSVDGPLDMGGGVSRSSVPSTHPSLAVVSPLSGCYPAYVAWEESGEIYMRFWNADVGIWQTTIGFDHVVNSNSTSASGAGVSDAILVGLFPSIAVDSQCRIVVAFVDDFGGLYKYHVHRFDPSGPTGSWQNLDLLQMDTVINVVEHAPRIALAIDNTDTVWIAYTYQDPEVGGLGLNYTEIYLQKREGLGGWEALPGYYVGDQSNDGKGISGTGTGVSLHPALAIDNDGNPVVAWEVSGHASIDFKSVIRLRRWNGSSWEELQDSGVNHGLITGPVFNLSGSAWPSLALDKDGEPIVAWEGAFSGQPRKIYVRRWTGTVWDTLASAGTGVHGGSGRNPSLDVNRFTREPVVAYHSEDTNEIYVRYWDTSVAPNTWADFVGVDANDTSSTGGGISDTGNYSSFASLGMSLNSPVVAWADTSSANNEIYLRRHAYKNDAMAALPPPPPSNPPPPNPPNGSEMTAVYTSGLGGAILAVTETRDMSVAGIGSSGTDGVVFHDLPAVSEWVSLDLACPNFGASSIGAEMNAQSHGSMLDSLLSTLSLLNVDGSTLQITAEFPALGATRYSATVSNGGLVTGAFTDLPFIAVTLPRACLIQAGFDTAGAIHLAFLDPVTFTVAGGGNATGDRLTLQPEDATIASPDTLVQLEAYFANTGDLLLTSAFAGLSSEVPAPVAVPALNRWGMAVLMTCLLGVAYIGERLWRHSRSHLSAR